MRIVVPIKQILDPSGITVRRDKERVFINRKDYIIDPASKAALEAALQVKDKIAAEVAALCLGKERADDALREALSMGCDTAYLLCDNAFDGADASISAKILAGAIRKLGGADLVVSGREAEDTGSGQVGPRLAAALDYAQITDAYTLEVSEDSVRATRKWAGGFALVQTPVPTVVTVAPSAYQPRYAHGARIMSAYREWEVSVWDADALGFEQGDLESKLTVRAQSFPAPLEIGEVFQGEPETVAREVIAALRQQKLAG